MLSPCLYGQVDRRGKPFTLARLAVVSYALITNNFADHPYGRATLLAGEDGCRGWPCSVPERNGSSHPPPGAVRRRDYACSGSSDLQQRLRTAVLLASELSSGRRVPELRRPCAAHHELFGLRSSSLERAAAGDHPVISRTRQLSVVCGKSWTWIRR
jgi:hypothetical protein